ncbi:unnamed protein product [Symbiodinium microadriaticum]|nr:unnamed protein product [Symbiodinium microadriaticum]
MSNYLESMSGPSGRTNFLRVTLNFQGNQDLVRKRQLQTRVLDKLKQMKSKSGIEGQDSCNLWITKDRSIEERIRIRALVLTKNFYEKLPQPADPAQCRPSPEIVWRGQVFVGQKRMLKSMDNGQEPTANDQVIEDARGNHTVWFLCSEAFSQVTGKPKEELQQMWADFGPDATPFGAGKVEKTITFCTGIGLILKDQGIRQYFASIHLPYKLREDCLQVWQQQVEELILFCGSKRYHDEIAFCCDLNYDVLDIVNVDERGVPLGQLLRIDFILFSLPSMTFWDDRVIEGSDVIVGKKAKKEWLASLLEKSAEGDFRAIAYFKKRNTAMYTQGSYCIRAGGRTKAIADLRAYYQRKYVPQEIRDVAFMCKHNKSTGADGISYEALQMLLQSELVFTKALMLRLRPQLPDIGAFQVGAIGLRMNWRKCKYIQTPGFPKLPLMTKVSNAFWAYYRILRILGLVDCKKKSQ